MAAAPTPDELKEAWLSRPLERASIDRNRWDPQRGVDENRPTKRPMPDPVESTSRGTLGGSFQPDMDRPSCGHPTWLSDHPGPMTRPAESEEDEPCGGP
jgi:hypothetical protein